MSEPEQGESFFGHLTELRTVFFKVLVCIAVLFPACYCYTTPVLEWFIASSCPQGFELKYFSPMEPFFVEMKLALVMSVFLGVPYIAYQIWSFVAPGLYSTERYAISRFAFASWFFFGLGAFFSIKFIFPLVLKFSMGFQSDYIKANIGIQNFVSMATMMTVGFGLMFQFPIGVFLLVRTGLVSVQTMRKHRPVVAIGILVLSALLTPPDVVSQLMMGVPTYILFEASLVFAQFARVRALDKKDKETEPDCDGLDDDDDLAIEDQVLTPEHAGVVALESEDTYFDDDCAYEPEYGCDEETWDYETHERKQELKNRKDKIRRNSRVRRIRGNS